MPCKCFSLPWESFALEESDSLSFSIYWLPVALHVEVRPCGIFSIHVSKRQPWIQGPVSDARCSQEVVCVCAHMQIVSLFICLASLAFN